MTRTPQHFSKQLDDDPRSPMPLVGDERELLTTYLDWQRQTFELKCAGVPADRLSEKAVSPSTMSLHGLLRHLSGVERWWFRIQFAGEDVPLLYYSDDDPDQDFDRLDGDVEEALAVWRGVRQVAGNRGGRVVGRYRNTLRDEAARVAAADPGAHHRRVRPPQRTRRPAAGADRRRHRPLSRSFR